MLSDGVLKCSTLAVFEPVSRFFGVFLGVGRKDVASLTSAGGGGTMSSCAECEVGDLVLVRSEVSGEEGGDNAYDGT